MRVLAEVFVFLGQRITQRNAGRCLWRGCLKSRLEFGYVIARGRLPAQGRAVVPGITVIRLQGNDAIQRRLGLVELAEGNQGGGMVVDDRGIAGFALPRRTLAALCLGVHAEHRVALGNILQQARRMAGGFGFQGLQGFDTGLLPAGCVQQIDIQHARRNQTGMAYEDVIQRLPCFGKP